MAYKGLLAHCWHWLLVPLLALASVADAGLDPLEEREMAAVTGAGLNFVWEDFRFLASPTSFFEQVGSQAAPGSTFKRGDLRWYGVSISATGGGYSWIDTAGTMTACVSQGNNGLGCPRGETIGHFAAHDNPYTLRVQDYAGDGSGATSIGNGVVTWAGDTDPVTSSQTVLELLAPTRQEDYRFAFWGEIEAGKEPLAGTNAGLLKNQTIIQGSAAGSELRLFQFTEAGNQSLAIQYLSRLQGDFRFSVNQATANASDALGQPVAFEATEGLHFRNVDAYIPLGQLYYQALTLDVPRNADNSYVTDGNFVLRLERIPDELAVYTRFYSLAVPDAIEAGYTTARMALLNQLPAEHNYYRTHGYSRWGDWTPCQGVGCPDPPTSVPAQRNSYNSTADGIFFSKCGNCDNFNALAYRINQVDVRAGNNQYTSYQRYANYAGCTPGTTGSARFNCGYGGAYSASGSVVTNMTGMTDPMSLVLQPSGSALATNVTLPVINTDVANLGDARIEGLQINHLQFTSYGASY